MILGHARLYNQTVHTDEYGMRQKQFDASAALFCWGNYRLCRWRSHASFGGRSDEYVVWLYGDDAASQFNGVAVLGNRISPHCVREKNGLQFTDFNRTLSDALANEAILDMQGITEAVSRYYYSHNESFGGLFVAPEYQDRFDRLANEAIEYYNS